MRKENSDENSEVDRSKTGKLKVFLEEKWEIVWKLARKLLRLLFYYFIRKTDDF